MLSFPWMSFFHRFDCILKQIFFLIYENFTISVEHIFEIVIEGVRGLSLFENMIWGEADCFVQYSFPTQQQSNPPGTPVIRHGKIH